MFIRKVCAGSQSSLALTSTGQVGLAPGHVFNNCSSVVASTVRMDAEKRLLRRLPLFPGLRLGLRRLSGLRLLRGHGAQTQAHRGAGDHQGGGHLHRRQPLPGPVTRYAAFTTATSSQCPRPALISSSLHTTEQTTRCTPGATTPWASAARATPPVQSPSPRRWWAWTEWPSSRSQPEPPTAWRGRPCPGTGDGWGSRHTGCCLQSGRAASVQAVLFQKQAARIRHQLSNASRDS